MKDSFVYIIATLTGISIWLGISFLGSTSEAWDSHLYYRYGLPSMSFVAGLLGYIVPIRVWRWGIAIVASQAFVLIIQKPSANLLPLGLVVFCGLSIPCILAAYVGAFIKKMILEQPVE